MRSVCYVLVLGALFLVQTTLSNFIWIFGLKPDLPLVFALCRIMAKSWCCNWVKWFFRRYIFGRFIGANTIAKITCFGGYGS